MRNIKLLLLITLFLIISGCSENIQAQTKDLKEEIKIQLLNVLPESIEIISIEETEVDGFLEVNFKGLEPLYISSNGKYLISGDIYEITNQGFINKSEFRRSIKRKEIIQGLSQEEVISFSPSGDLKNEVFVFTDVDCGYCRKFHSKISDYLALGIKVNYLAFPRTGLESDSYNKIVSAWCDEDPNKAITELKLGNKIDTNLCLNNPVEKHYNLGQTIGISGTPSIITKEGRMIPGYVSPEELFELLNG